MKFESPLLLLLLVPVAVRLVVTMVDRRRRLGAFRYSALSILERGGGLRAATSFLPPLVEAAALALLVVALARPQEVEAISAERRGIDIVIALDASGSMAAEDFQPRNRFDVAKELVAQFIGMRENDRIGVVTFGASAATRVPVTFDKGAAREVLQSAEIGQNGDGTAIGMALATAVNRLRTSPARSRVIVLLTDGVHNAGAISPPAAAELAARAGIRIYAIGIGSYGPVRAPVRMQNPFTGEIETVYQMIRADLDEPMLRGVAHSTGGSYYRATDERALASVLRTIDRLETSRLAAPPDVVVDELYPPYLLGGLLLLVLGLLAGETLWMRLPA